MAVPHASFPFDESPWVTHFHDADEANQRAQIHAAGMADDEGHDALARHIMQGQPGSNPYAGFKGPFFEGYQGLQFAPRMPARTMEQHFGQFAFPGGVAGQGPFADPRKFTQPGAAGPAVTGTPYTQRMQQGGFDPQSNGPAGSAF
jgi:hypothetical protein